MASKKLALTSLVLAGALAFAGCASGSSDTASDSSSSVSATAAATPTLSQADKDSLKEFVADYTNTLLTTNLLEGESPKDALSDITNDDALRDIRNVSEMTAAFDKLPADKHQKAMDYVEKNDPLYGMTDHEGMSDGEIFLNSFVNIAAAVGIESARAVGPLPTEGMGSVDLEKVTFDENKATIPNSAINSASQSSNSNEDLQFVDAIFVDGSWKLNGKASLDRKAAAMDSSYTPSASASPSAS